MCFPRSESAFWHCLRHPRRSGAVFRRFCSSPEWGWLRRGYQPRGTWAVGSPWSSEVPGELCCLFYEEEILQHFILSHSHKTNFRPPSTLLSLVYTRELYTACKDMILKSLWVTMWVLIYKCLLKENLYLNWHLNSHSLVAGLHCPDQQHSLRVIFNIPLKTYVQSELHPFFQVIF